MANFRIVNPHIEGKFKKLLSAKTADDAAVVAWKRISKYITNNVPNFAFTIEQVNDNSLYHYLVKESIKKNQVNYSIDKIEIKQDDENIKKFRDALARQGKKLEGGRRKNRKGKNKDDDEDEDEDDSDLDDDIYSRVSLQKQLHQPIYYWWYYPNIYQKIIDTIWVPTFVAPLAPYVELQLVDTLWSY